MKKLLIFLLAAMSYVAQAQTEIENDKIEEARVAEARLGCSYAVVPLPGGRVAVVKAPAELLPNKRENQGSWRIDIYLKFDPTKKNVVQTASYRTTVTPWKPAQITVVSYATGNVITGLQKLDQLCGSAKPAPTATPQAGKATGETTTPRITGAVAAVAQGKLDGAFYPMTKEEQALFAQYPFITSGGVRTGAEVEPLLKDNGFIDLLPLNNGIPQDEKAAAAVKSFAAEWQRATNVPVVASSVGVRLLLKKAAAINQASPGQVIIQYPQLSNQILDATMSIASPWVDAELLYYGMRGTGPTKGIDPVAEISRVVSVRGKAGANYKAALQSCFNQIRDKQETNAEEKSKVLRTWLYDHFIEQTPLKWMNQLTSPGEPDDEARYTKT